MTFSWDVLSLPSDRWKAKESSKERVPMIKFPLRWLTPIMMLQTTPMRTATWATMSIRSIGGVFSCSNKIEWFRIR